LFDVEDLIFSKIHVQSITKIKGYHELSAIVKGEKFDKKKHEIGTEVKAVTYSFMTIEEKENRIIVNIVFDI
jgi:SHS2 domain-containing protein